jgi:hypothetical protein
MGKHTHAHRYISTIDRSIRDEVRAVNTELWGSHSCYHIAHYRSSNVSEEPTSVSTSPSLFCHLLHALVSVFSSHSYCSSQDHFPYSVPPGSLSLLLVCLVINSPNHFSLKTSTVLYISSHCECFAQDADSSSPSHYILITSSHIRLSLLPWRWKQHVRLKCSRPTRLRGIMSQIRVIL